MPQKGNYDWGSTLPPLGSATASKTSNLVLSHEDTLSSSFVHDYALWTRELPYDFVPTQYVNLPPNRETATSWCEGDPYIFTDLQNTVYSCEDTNEHASQTTLTHWCQCQLAAKCLWSQSIVYSWVKSDRSVCKYVAVPFFQFAREAKEENQDVFLAPT